MAGWTLKRLRVVALTVGLVVVVAGCGGGGGGAAADDTGRPISGPTTPPTSAGQISGVTWLQASVIAERDIFSASAQPTLTASLAMQAKGVADWFRYTHDPSLSDVSYTFRAADDGIDFSVRFLAFPERARGSYSDTLSVTVCYDEVCSREAPGSPYKLPLRLDVGYLAQAEEGVTPLAPALTTALSHDVLGVGYSAALDAVITVSARPEPLLRVHELRSGLTRSYPLLTAPSSLSAGADGLQAAVGHDAAVSLVDLRAGAESPVKRIDVPMPVGSVVLAGTRIVAIGAQVFNGNSIYWVDTVTAAATKAGFAAIYGLAGVVLHPAGDRIYLADRGVSPDDVSRMYLGGDPGAAQIHDTRNHGEYPFCGRLAISPDGRRVYTGCGVVLGTAALLGDDMVYAGRMALTPVDPVTLRPYFSVALSVAPDNTSVTLLEENQHSCDPRTERLTECPTRVAVYDTTTLERRSLRGLAPFERGGDRLQQWGRHLMHRADGSRIVIAEVRTRNEATPTWLLHRLDP